MLYSTCSIFRAENEAQVDAFLARQDDATEVPLDRLAWARSGQHGRQILTGEHDMDGFYYALLRRNA